MQKFTALLPWNLCLLLTTIKAVAGGVTQPIFQFPLLGPAYSVSGLPAAFLYGGFFGIMIFCSVASYKILFNRAYELLVDTIPNYLIFLGARYVIPIILLEFISTEENSILRQPMVANPVFWMTFGYFMMTDTVIFWGKYRPEDTITVRVMGHQFEVRLRYIFWLSVLVETVFFTTELNKYTQPGKKPDNLEEINNQNDE